MLEPRRLPGHGSFHHEQFRTSDTLHHLDFLVESMRLSFSNIRCEAESFGSSSRRLWHHQHGSDCHCSSGMVSPVPPLPHWTGKQEYRHHSSWHHQLCDEIVDDSMEKIPSYKPSNMLNHVFNRNGSPLREQFNDDRSRNFTLEMSRRVGYIDIKQVSKVRILHRRVFSYWTIGPCRRVDSVALPSRFLLTCGCNR